MSKENQDKGNEKEIQKEGKCVMQNELTTLRDILKMSLQWLESYCDATDLFCESLFSNVSIKQISHAIKFVRSDFLYSFVSFLNLDSGCKSDL